MVEGEKLFARGFCLEGSGVEWSHKPSFQDAGTAGYNEFEFEQPLRESLFNHSLLLSLIFCFY